MPKGATAKRKPTHAQPHRSNSPPPISVLFRYRDLVQPTLERHQEILKKNNQVWWGWWKRPTEDARLDVWKFLEKQLGDSPDGRVRVGLYDSGEKNPSIAIHAAWIDAIRIPQAGEATALDPLSLGQDELELVPRYYRDSPFSRAWMRIVEFETTPLAFFRKYSFEEVPPHLRYSASALKHIKGKVILEPRELRDMDSTLWRVRPRTESDSEEQLITARTQIADPISDIPVKTNGQLIIHISDPHYSVGKTREQHVWRLESETEPTDSLAGAISRALQGRHVAAMIITGDFTVLGTKKEFEEAAASLNSLIGTFGLGPEHVVIVPGNHDINWSKPEDAKYDPEQEVDAQPNKATANYRDFYRAVLGHVPDERLTIARRYALAHGGLVEICGVNSSSLATGKRYLAGMGRVDGGSFDAAAKKLGWDQRNSLAVRFLALHHHLVPTNDAEDPSEYYSGFGMAMDATRVQRMSARHGVHLALHGHRHRAFLWRSDVYELPEDARDEWALGALSLVGGGSAGARSAGEQRNYFNAITICADSLTIEMYQSKNLQQFELIGTWHAQFDLSNGRLQLGPWSRVNPKAKS